MDKMTINSDFPDPEDPNKKDSTPEEEPPVLGKSQPLPNPEAPAGYEWYQPSENEELPDTQPIPTRSIHLENLPTVNVHSKGPFNANVEVRFEDPNNHPPGSADGLPARVDEIDLEATRVTPSALRIDSITQPPRGSGTAAATKPSTPETVRTVRSTPNSTAAKPTGTPQPVKGNGGGNKPPRKNGKPGNGFDSRGCFVKVLVIFLFIGVILLVAGGAFLVIQYFSIASTLPSVEDIRGYASQFETTRFYDRNGEMIYEMIDPNAGRRTYTSLDKISPYVVAATIAT